MKGQLGIGSYQKQNSPTKVRSFWRDFSTTDYYNTVSTEKDIYFPEQLSEFVEKLPNIKQFVPNNLQETLMDVVAGGLSTYLITCPIVEV